MGVVLKEIELIKHRNLPREGHGRAQRAALLIVSIGTFHDLLATELLLKQAAKSIDHGGDGAFFAADILAVRIGDHRRLECQSASLGWRQSPKTEIGKTLPSDRKAMLVAFGRF